jgi:hypothetical protein
VCAFKATLAGCHFVSRQKGGKMSNIIEKAIKAGDLPPQLRGNIEEDALVLVSVRRLTGNGFTEEFEEGVLKAEEETEGMPFRPAEEVIKELKAIAADES